MIAGSSVVLANAQQATGAAGSGTSKQASGTEDPAGKVAGDPSAPLESPVTNAFFAS